MIDRVDAFEAESDVDEHEDRSLPARPLDRTGLDHLTLVHSPVDAAHDSQSGRFVRVDQGLDRACGGRRTEPLANLLSELLALSRELMDREWRKGRRVVEEEGENARVRRGLGDRIVRIRKRSSPV